MSDIWLDPDTHDLALADGDLALTTGEDAVRQRLKQALLAFKGEWFLDLADGVPYFQDILGVKNPNVTVVESLLQDAILSTPGVVELTAFDLQIDNVTRIGSLTFEARDDGGNPINFDAFNVAGG